MVVQGSGNVVSREVPPLVALDPPPRGGDHLTTDSRVGIFVRPRPSRPLSSHYINLAISQVTGVFRRKGFDLRLHDTSHNGWPGDVAEARFFLFTTYIDEFTFVVEHAKAIHDLNPSAVVVVGGPHVTLLRQDVLRITEEFDVVCLGDAVAETADLLASLDDRPAGTIFVETPNGSSQDLGTYPALDLWNPDVYLALMPIEFSRGCRHHCPFCTDPVLRSGVTTSPIQHVLDVVSGLRDRGIAHARFVDSSLTSLGEPLNDLLRALIRVQNPVSWGAFGYAEDITDELADRLGEAGCTAIFLGVESLSPRVRTGKRHTRDPEIVDRSVTILRQRDIFVHGNFIVGLPGETEDSALETIRAGCQIAFDSVGGGPFYLTPGSTFDRYSDRFGIKVLDPEWKIKQHKNFWEPQPYFRTAEMELDAMRDLSIRFKEACMRAAIPWGMSDYQMLAWESAGGARGTLADLWIGEAAVPSSLEPVLDTLREKAGTEMTGIREGSFLCRLRELVSATQ